jgi:hypothetical protein
VIADLRAFFRRAAVVELLVAFTLAGGVVYFVEQLVQNWVFYPIVVGRGEFDSGRPLSFVIGGREFDSIGIVAGAAAVLILLLGAAVLVRFTGAELWSADDAYRECPHCLSEIAAAASVCSFCTRAVGSTAEAQSAATS